MSMDRAHPICRHCRYDLITQLDQRAPGWRNGDEPVELWCPECDQTSTWPWVAPPPAPHRIPLVPFLLSFIFLAAFGVILFYLISRFVL